MRVAILAHSFDAAAQVYREVGEVPNWDCFIVLSPSPRRAPIVSLGANIARVMRALSSDFKGSSQVMRDGKLILLRNSLGHPSSVDRLRSLAFDVGLHQSGIIYRPQTIDAFRLGILNSHIGILPQYRGRSVMEWSLLQDDPTGITVFFIDEGIDTGGRIVVAEEVDVSHCKSIIEAKQFLFNLAGIFFKKALIRLAENESPPRQNDGSGKRYYVMSKLFTDVAERVLTNK